MWDDFQNLSQLKTQNVLHEHTPSRKICIQMLLAMSFTKLAYGEEL